MHLFNRHKKNKKEFTEGNVVLLIYVAFNILDKSCTVNDIRKFIKKYAKIYNM